MFKIYYKKTEALENLKANKGKHLFSEDIPNSDSKKQFFISDYKTLFNVCNGQTKHYYENVEVDESVKLYLDIDYKLKENDTMNGDFLLNQCLNLVNDKLDKEYDINDPSIIVLTASTNQKISFHIIYNNVSFYDIYKAKKFMSEIKHELIDNKVLDMNIYKTSCFRILWSSKLGKNNSLKYYKSFNYNKTTDEQLFYDCLVKNTLNNTYEIEYVEEVKPEPIVENKEVVKEYKNIDLDNIVVNTEEEELFYMLNPAKYDDYNDWVKLGLLIKSLKFSFDVFHNISKLSPKYKSEDECRNVFNGLTPKRQISMGLLHYLAKKDNVQKYNEYRMKQNNIKKKLREDAHVMSRRYLLANQKLDDIENDEYQKRIHEFMTNDNYKVLSQRSPYDTGKTNGLKEIIRKYNNMRILFLSYRRTLTNDLLSEFGEFGFEDYKNNKNLHTYDRVIVQIESLLKLSPDYLFNDYVEYPKFDLIIIDEIESCLNQFSSKDTFKKNSPKEVFEFLEKVIENSLLQNGKILCLDGDIDDRSYCFLDHFQQLSETYKSHHIINDVVVRKLNFTITEDDKDFKQKFINDIEQNHKVILVSLNSTLSIEYEKELKTSFPNKSIKIYTSKTDDETKEKDLKNVRESWLCDVLIYTPTIESGVNFDVDNHFEKIYGVICAGSTSPRGFFQMLNRCRKLKENNILVLNQSLVFHNTSEFYTYDEVKEGLIFENDIKLSAIDVRVDNKIMKKLALTLHDKIYIHNRVEDINKMHYFLDIFVKMSNNKGHTVTFETFHKKHVKTDDNNAKSEKIINANDITFETYNELKKKQEQCKATEKDKYEIEKHCLKTLYGVDKLNSAILHVKKEQLNNFIYLVDESNIPDKKDNFTNEIRQRTKLIKDLLVDIGFNNVFSTTTIQKAELQIKITNIVKTNKLFTEMKKTKVLFNLERNKNFDENVTIKQFLGFISTLFNDYCIDIGYKNKRIGKAFTTEYFLMVSDSNIHEIIQYKMRKGFQLNDKDNLFTNLQINTKKYSDLVDWTKVHEIIDYKNDPVCNAVFA